jgi:hypothetical protein
LERTIHAELRAEHGVSRIALRTAENETRPDIVLSTGEAALLAIEIQQLLGESMLHSRVTGSHRRLSLNFSKGKAED